jgi:gluconokinase
MPPLLVVMGVSGVGKSTIAHELALALDVESADGDDFHTADSIASMRAGTPLTDDDRRGWLADIGRWLAAHDDVGGVVSCSALKRAYRDMLRSAAPRTAFVHLTADHETVLVRMQGREHFMAPSLLDSQEKTLEPLESDETGWVIDSRMAPTEIVESVKRALGGAGPAGTPG